MTPSGIKPTTFRFVAQHLNHCATAVYNMRGQKSHHHHHHHHHICYGVGPHVDPLRSHVSKSLFKGFSASFRETCQWLIFSMNGLRAQGRVRPVVGLLPLASGPACSGMAFPPFLVNQLYRCDSVIISSFVRTGYTTRR